MCLQKEDHLENRSIGLLFSGGNEVQEECLGLYHLRAYTKTPLNRSLLS